tara:strand:- start:335 stop:952 length:618 start_codon:yes stop_codon:yes gene_type:complete
MKKLILFDLDGVLFNSIKNMELSWNEVMKKFLIKKEFNQYKKHIGLPFKKILLKLNIKHNQSSIENYYQKKSLEYLHKIKPYPNVLKKIKNYDSKRFLIGIWTSKHRLRVNKILKKYNLKFDFIIAPKKGIRGKPYPDQVTKCLKSLNMLNKNVFFIGDMKTDREAAKKSKINFIFASYGFGKIKDKKLNRLSNFKDVYKIVERL